MPLTPFHWGPVLLLGTLLPRRLDLPTLLVASVIVDVRAALVLFGPLPPPVHGVLTTFLGGTAVALAVAVAIRAVPGRLTWLLDYARLGPTDATRPILAAALVGVYSHVLLDSVLYFDARPLFPLDWNPFLVGVTGYLAVYAGCVIAGVLGLVLFAVRYPWGRVTKQTGFG